MLQSQVALWKTQSVALVEPAFLVVSAFLLVPAREKAGRAFLGIAKIFAQDAGGIGEVHYIIAEEKIVLDNVPDEAAKKRDVAAGTDRHPILFVTERALARLPNAIRQHVQRTLQ